MSLKLVFEYLTTLHTQTFDFVIDNAKTTQYQDRLQYQLYCRVYCKVVVSFFYQLHAIFKLCLIEIDRLYFLLFVREKII